MNKTLINIKAIIAAANKKDIPFTADLLVRIAYDCTTYELLDLVCNYVNAFEKISNHKEAVTICQLTKENQELKHTNNNMTALYNEALNSLLKSKEDEIDLKKMQMEYEKKISELSNQINRLEADLARKIGSIIISVGMLK